jgi:hypothetical protein
MSYEAIKCPDCGTWWRTAEHKCPPVSSTAKKENCKCQSLKDKPKLPPILCVICKEPAGIYSMFCEKHRSDRYKRNTWDKDINGEHKDGKKH